MADQPELAFDRGIFWCWVVWAFKVGDIQLAAICTTEEIANRYVANITSEYPEHRLYAERAPLDHLFGGSDLRSVAFRAATSKYRRSSHAR